MASIQGPLKVVDPTAKILEHELPDVQKLRSAWRLEKKGRVVPWFQQFHHVSSTFRIKRGCRLSTKKSTKNTIRSLPVFTLLPATLGTHSVDHVTRLVPQKPTNQLKSLLLALVHEHSWPSNQHSSLGLRDMFTGNHAFPVVFSYFFPWFSGTPGFPDRSQRSSVIGLHCQAWGDRKVKYLKARYGAMCATMWNHVKST